MIDQRPYFCVCVPGIFFKYWNLSSIHTKKIKVENDEESISVKVFNYSLGQYSLCITI